jgi:hypothetical protein
MIVYVFSYDLCHSYDLWPSLRYRLLFNDILNIFAINIWWKK